MVLAIKLLLSFSWECEWDYWGLALPCSKWTCRCIFGAWSSWWTVRCQLSYSSSRGIPCNMCEFNNEWLVSHTPWAVFLQPVQQRPVLVLPYQNSPFTETSISPILPQLSFSQGLMTEPFPKFCRTDHPKLCQNQFWPQLTPHFLAVQSCFWLAGWSFVHSLVCSATCGKVPWSVQGNGWRNYNRTKWKYI